MVLDVSLELLGLLYLIHLVDGCGTRSILVQGDTLDLQLVSLTLRLPEKSGLLGVIVIDHPHIVLPKLCNGSCI